MAMMTKLFLSRAIRKLPILAAMAGAALTAQACSRAEAEPQADTVQVQAYLDQLEGEEQRTTGEAKRKDAQDRTLHNLVEGAAVRAPSEAAINRLETVVAAKL